MYAVHPDRFQRAEPAWRDVSRSFVHRDVRYRQALLDRGSLTARLVAASKGKFKVRVLYQGWAKPRFSEQRLLDLDCRRRVLLREVLLCCDGEPWVFARSVMPVATLSGRLRHLRKFDDSALGAMLFSDPSMRRTGYQLADFGGFQHLIPEQAGQRRAEWGRRSLFWLDDKPLMVSEIFLDSFNA